MDCVPRARVPRTPLQPRSSLPPSVLLPSLRLSLTAIIFKFYSQTSLRRPQLRPLALARPPAAARVDPQTGEQSRRRRRIKLARRRGRIFALQITFTTTYSFERPLQILSCVQINQWLSEGELDKKLPLFHRSVFSHL